MNIDEKQQIYRKIERLQDIINCLEGVTPSVTIIFTPKDIKAIAVNLIKGKIEEYKNELNPTFKNIREGKLFRLEDSNKMPEPDNADNNTITTKRPIIGNLIDIREVVDDLHKRVIELESCNGRSYHQEHLEYIRNKIKMIDVIDFKFMKD